MFKAQPSSPKRRRGCVFRGAVKYLEKLATSGPANALNAINSGFVCMPDRDKVFAWSTEGTWVGRPFIQIRWQSSDLAVLQTPPLGTAAETSTSSAPTGTASLERPGNSDPEPGSGGGLSVGAKAGIGVGTAVAVLFACIAAILLIRRYRAKRLGGQVGEEAGSFGPYEIDGKGKATPTVELSIYPVSRELGTSNHDVQELDPSPRENLAPLELQAASIHPTAPQTAFVEQTPAPALGASLSQPTPPAVSLPDYSALPEVVEPSPDALEIAALQARQDTLERERQRILRLQEIEAEQTMLQQRISAVTSRGVGSTAPREQI